mgnify:CR=1 FL=1
MSECLVADPEVVFRDEGEDGAILFHPVTGEVKILNETGAFIFKLCDGKHTKEDIIRNVIEAFEAQSPDEVVKDVENFLKETREKELVGLILE